MPDYSLESAICKVSGTEFLWYAANRTLQLKGGEGYLRTQPFEKVLRDIRIFPIFEGANDVLRAFVALSGLKPLGEKLSGLGEIGLSDPIGSIGVLIDYFGGRIQREVRPDRISQAHPELSSHADAVSDQVKELREVSESLLRKHKREIVSRQFAQKRLADSIADIFAQIAVLSRVTSIFDDHGVEPSGQERYIAETFCTRAADRVRSAVRPARTQRRRADVGDRQARLQARRVRLRPVQRLERSPRGRYRSSDRGQRSASGFSTATAQQSRSVRWSVSRQAAIGGGGSARRSSMLPSNRSSLRRQHAGSLMRRSRSAALPLHAALAPRGDR